MSATVGLYMSDEQEAKLDALCNQQQRNRSNMMQWLIEQEYRRQFGTSATEEPEPLHTRNSSDSDGHGAL